MKKNQALAIALASAGAMSCTAAGQTVRAVFSEIAGDPTSLVPGGADVPKGTLFTAFDRPFRSPDGQLWIISATSNLAASEDEVIIVGNGLDGTTVVREGTAFGSPTIGELVGLIDLRLSIADSGAYVFATNTDGPTTSDEYIVHFNGVTWLPIAQEGAPVVAFPTESYGTTLDAPFILNDGLTVGFRAPSTDGTLGSDFDDFLIQGINVVAQEGTTIPGNQAGGATETWDNFDANDFFGSADGTSYIALGDLSGDLGTDDVAVVDDAVVLQEGSVIAGTPFTSPLETILEITQSSNGDWFARGDNDDQQDWVVRNGDLAAVSGTPIVLGSSETFSDGPFAATFFWMAGNNNGDYVIGGTTSNVDADADAVLVLNGTTVVARQGDPVDLDGNGTYDDDVFINIFNNDDGFLTDDSILYFTADLIDSTGAALGQGYLHYDVSGLEPCLGDIDSVPANGVVNVLDLLALLSAWGDCPDPCINSCTGDLNGDCIVNVLDLLQLLQNWGECP